jgi:hypothetical protein
MSDASQWKHRLFFWRKDKEDAESAEVRRETRCASAKPPTAALSREPSCVGKGASTTQSAQRPEYRGHREEGTGLKTGRYICALWLDVGDAFGTGLGEMFFVPVDGAVGPVDDVFGFANAVALARIADEDGFCADVF